MPSKSAKAYEAAAEKARLLVIAATNAPDSSDKLNHKASCLHAALAAYVGAWESYLEKLVRESQGEIADGSNHRLTSVLAVLSPLTEAAIKKFNTPNAENARTLLIEYTGYDPINDWAWISHSMNAIATRTRVNETLQIRHSFAHGFSVPTTIAWVKSGKKAGVLTVSALKETAKLFSFLVSTTDKGMEQHLLNSFGVTTSW